MKGLKRKIRDHKVLRYLLILSNWLSQGIHNSDRTEKMYRILFTIIFWFLFFSLFRNRTEWSDSFLLSICFLIAHTLNWILNGNIHLLLVHRLMIKKVSKEAAFSYIDGLEERVKGKDWVQYTVIFGSIARASFHGSSDLDVSIVRKPGLRNAFCSLAFTIKEKKLADFNSIPLELYISDSPENSIRRFGAEDTPLVISDPEDILGRYYKKQISINEARLINGIR